MDYPRRSSRFSPSRWADRHRYRRQHDIDRHIRAPRGSGLPEQSPKLAESRVFGVAMGKR
jgi:hypothetical protein